jgi:hypothetical protein
MLIWSMFVKIQSNPIGAKSSPRTHGRQSPVDVI